MTANLTSLDLGRLELISYPAGLRLRVSNRIRLSCLDGENAALLAQAAQSKYDTDRPFIRHSGNYTVTLNVELHQNIPLNSQQFCRVFISAIAEAQLWSQLGFVATSTHTRSIPTERGTLIEAVSHLNINPSHSHTIARNHDMAKNVPFWDIQPVQGMPILTLENVDVTMIVEKLDCVCSHMDMIRPSTSTLMPTPPRSNVCSSEGCPSPVSEWLSKSSSPCSDYLHAKSKQGESTQVVVLENVMEIINSGLRLSISRKIHDISNKFTIAACESWCTLSETIPESWSNGYMQTAASRFVLIPTIAEAFNRVGSRAMSVGLRSKSRQLHQMLPFCGRLRHNVLHLRLCLMVMTASSNVNMMGGNPPLKIENTWRRYDDFDLDETMKLSSIDPVDTNNDDDLEKWLDY